MFHSSDAMILVFLIPVLLISSCGAGKEIHPSQEKSSASETFSATVPRSKIPQKYKWHLEDIFPSDDAWKKEFNRLKKSMKTLSKYENKLGSSPKTMAECLDKMYDMELKLEKVYWYATMKHHTDQEITRYQEMHKLSQMLMVDFNKETSFVEPEILSLPTTKLQRFLKSKYLKKYSFYIERLLRMRKHVRSKEVEAVLAKSGNLMRAPTGIFEGVMVDIKFPKIKDEKGNEVELTVANYPRYRASTKRSVRKAAVEKFFSTLMKHKNTLANTLAAAVTRDVFSKEVRNYKSSLEAALYPDKIDPSVYTTLLSTLKNNMGRTLHRYVKMRKEILRLKNIYFYDLYNPLVPDFEKKVPYEDGIKEITEALKPLGEEYIKVVSKAMKPGSGWIDVYPNKGKRFGAYSLGLYGIHPFVLHNYLGNLDSVFTTAHEFGHSMHSYFSNKTQPYIYADYPIFLAEIASTVNEELLLRHLLKKAKTRKEKLYLLNQRLENIRLTIFRQAMFADFEKRIHEYVESGKPLTADTLNNTYAELVKLFYGPAYTMNKIDGIEWSYVPHFYRSFYVYQYATGLTSAIAIVERIQKLGKPAVDDYMKLLKAGASDYPLNILKKAGVDLTTDKPYKAMLDLFEKTLKEFEKTYRNK